MVTRSKLILGLFALLLITTPAIAGLKDIRTDRLPQEESVQKAYAEAADVEEFAPNGGDLILPCHARHGRFCSR
jgi:hypothetical protein